METVRLEIDPEKYDSKMGKMWQDGTSIRWKNELNLTEIDFFSKDKQDQLRVVGDFLKKSYEYSKILRAKK